MAGSSFLCCTISNRRADYEHRFLVLYRAARFVSGFSSLSPQEQAQYDQARLARDTGNNLFLWAGIMLVGAVLSALFGPYLAIPAYLVWGVLFFGQVHLDVYKAFESYKLH